MVDTKLVFHNIQKTIPSLNITNNDTSFYGLTGGVYEIREQNSRAVLTHDYWRFHLHVFEFQKTICTKESIYRLTV